MNTILPVSLGARCINKDWFGMSMDEVWSVMEDYLHFISHAYDIRIHLFVLMSNHYHMVARAPQNNMPAAMQYFQTETSRRITKAAGRINHLWRQKYFRSIIGGTRYYLHAYKYFYRNPVEAKICERVQDYPYSTLHGLLGHKKLIIPVCSDDTLFAGVDDTLAWLNTPPEKGHSEIIRKALRRREFKLPRDPKKAGRHPLEDEKY